jgi:hypothetical protein
MCAEPDDLRAFAGYQSRRNAQHGRSPRRVVHFQLSGRCRAHVQHHVRMRRVVILGRGDAGKSALAREPGERRMSSTEPLRVGRALLGQAGRWATNYAG